MSSRPETQADVLSQAALYKQLVRGLHSRAIFLTDVMGYITSWNPGVEQLLGYGELEWVGQSAAIIFTPQDLAGGKFEEEMREATRTGEAADVRWHQRKDGSLIFVDGVLVSLTDEQGTLVGFSKVMRDATDSKQAEESLRRSEEQLRVAQEAAQLGIWDWDLASNLITRSEIHYKLFGQQPKSAPESYAQWLSYLYPEDRTRVEFETQHALRTGVVDTQFRISWPDGQVRWMHARGKVYFDRGTPLRMVRIVQDITAEKAAEQALADSNARKTAILNASLDAVLVMDSEGGLQEFNPAAEQMFGYERKQAIGRRLADVIVPPALREAHARGLARYLTSGETRVLGKRIEITAMRSDESEFPVELAIVRVPVQGPPVFAGYVRDITERKRAENALRRSNEELGEFANVVAHDLQTPLRTVHAYTELLSQRYKGQFDARADELIAHVLAGTRTMETLIHEILQYATAGEEAPRESVNLCEAVQTVTRGLAALMEETGAEVICEDLPMVSASPVQMQQLFQNLIGNAIKYRRPGVTPQVRIRSEFFRDQWSICIIDNGEGIPKEHQERIFAPLSRLHGSDIPGTGLGLAVCKNIVERLGGGIWVESEPGRGSTFRFSLPNAKP